MKELIYNDRVYLQSELMNSAGAAVHGFTGSRGGVSCGKVSGLNLGFRVGDSPDSVNENYRLVAADLGLDLNRMVLSRQTHTDNIRIVTAEDAGKGITRESDIYDTDGLITDVKGISLVVFAADCVPILLLDPVKGVAGAVHSGWRGTVKGIGGKAVSLMKDVCGSNPNDIIAAIGPSIGPCCFEFGLTEAEENFGDRYCRASGGGKALVDIWGMNIDILKAAGIAEKNIDLSGVCTVCNADKYYSYRTHKDATGRQAAVICLL